MHMHADQITAAARSAYYAAINAGLDPAAALDNAGEAIRGLVGDRTGAFDQGDAHVDVRPADRGLHDQGGERDVRGPLVRGGRG